MDRLEAMRLFTQIVDLGSFTKAAGLLEIPRATATHAMKELEQRLGVRLLERTTRNVKPTLDGRGFYERCCRILADVEDAEASLDISSANPTGVLRLGLHGTHATQIILPRLAEFRQRYPRLDIVISSGDRLVDLVGEGIDCVVRVGVPKDSSLVAKRLASLPEVICASPEYLARCGTPLLPADLGAHQAVGFFTRNHNIQYPFTFLQDGQVKEYKAGSWIAVDNADSYTQCALLGFGLIQVPCFRVEKYLQTGQLVAVLKDQTCPELPVLALYPSHHQLAPRVKVFVEWVSKVYADYFSA
ncbi:DNA-binding transcriptional regulator, LysR family [Collimonas sp. OK607]|uniref:LysR substrate-binding domain-containing protein n=1 Tax=Collimonas sp. OK607 TaxID=1798194 RepID=UPI0008F3935B|nr:LysR family transcriptional regulator [Collimonas sp. OK607]SFA89870.1 DNA-binding transcriptional regulator, LysR family [Collimonas sp. OK607]